MRWSIWRSDPVDWYVRTKGRTALYVRVILGQGDKNIFRVDQ